MADALEQLLEFVQRLRMLGQYLFRKFMMLVSRTKEIVLHLFKWTYLEDAL